MLQFKPPAAHSVRIPAGEAQGFTPPRSPSASCHISHEQDNGLQDISLGVLPLWGVKRRMWEINESAPHMLGGEGYRGDQRFPRVGMWKIEWIPQVGCCGLGSRGFDPRDFFLLELRSSRLRGFCGLDLRLLRPGRLPGGSHCRLLGHLCDRLRRGSWISCWSGGCPDDTHPLDDVSIFGLESWPFYTDLCWFVSSSIG